MFSLLCNSGLSGRLKNLFDCCSLVIDPFCIRSRLHDTCVTHYVHILMLRLVVFLYVGASVRHTLETISRRFFSDCFYFFVVDIRL